MENYNLESLLNPMDYVMSRQEAIIEYYLNTTISKTLIRSPFRNDKNPTCGFYYNSNGVLRLHDFATEEFFSVIDIVKQLFKLNYYQALDKIIKDKDNFSTLEYKEEAKEEIEWIAGDPSHLVYFNKYKVITTDILLKYRVFSAKTILTNSYILAKGHKTNPLFVYCVDDKIKWYKPLTKDATKKWGGTTNSKTFFGYSQLQKKGRILFITSSLKDVIVLRGLGFNAIALNGEGYGSAEDSTSGKELRKKINQLEKRFEHIIFYMNNDVPGRQFNMQLGRTYNKKYIQNPINKPKDPSDYIVRYGVRRTKQMLQKQLSHLFKVSIDEIPF
jgi:hypothetical protein